MTNMGTGAIKAEEGIANAASDLIFNPWEQRINYAYDYLTKGKKTADENLKDLKEQQKRDIKKNTTQEILDKTGYSDVVDDLEKDSLVKRNNLGGQVAQGIGGMVPALVMGQALGTTPELTNLKGLSGKEKAAAIASNIGKTYVSQLPSNTMLGASSYGSGMEEALNEGADMNKARLYGLTNAAIEQGTEMLTGGVPGLQGKGGLDQLSDIAINKTGGYVNPTLKTIRGALGEGLEESAGTYLDALAQKGILGKDINWKDVNKEALQSGITGAITGAVLNSPETIQDYKSVQKTPIQKVQSLNEVEKQALVDITNKRKTGQQLDENDIATINYLNSKDIGQESQLQGPFKDIDVDIPGLEKINNNKQAESTQKQAVDEETIETRPTTQEETKVSQKEIKTPIKEQAKIEENASNEKQDAKVQENEVKNVNGKRMYNGINYGAERYKNLSDNDIKTLDTIYRKQRNKETLTSEDRTQLDYLKRKAQGIKNPELKTNNTFEDLKSDYGKYYKKANLDNFDYTMLDKAKETIQANKQGRRTKQEWLDIAQNIGNQASNLNSEELKKYAMESFKAAAPNQTENLNRQGQKYVKFGIDEWVNKVYEGAGVGKKIENVENNKNIVKTDNIIEKNAEKMQKQEEYLGNKENIPAEMEKEPVLKVKTPQEEKQHLVDNGVDEETAKILSEIPKPEKQKLSEKIKEGKATLKEEWSYFKRNLVDKGESIYTLGKKKKNPLLYAKYDKRGTTTGEANYDIGKAQTDLNGKKYKNFTDSNGNKTSMSLNQIWDGIDPEVANEYLAHYLNVDRYKQVNENGRAIQDSLQKQIDQGKITQEYADKVIRENKGNKYVFGKSITDQDSLNKVKQLEKKYPELKRFGENIWQYQKNQLQDRVNAGQISQAQADQWLNETPHYVPLQRNVDKQTSPMLQFDKNGNAKVNKNIKEFKGSTLDILPFKEVMAQNTLNTRNSIRDNIFAQELAKTMGVSATGEQVNNIDDIMGMDQELLKDNGDGTYSLTFFNNGAATTIPITEGIYESLQPNKHYKFEDKLLFKGVRKFDNVRKALLTDKNPMFLATNMMKDAFDAPLNSKYPAQFVKNYPRAIKEIMTNGEYYQQYEALGGLQNSYFEHNEFQKQGSKLNPLTWIEKANNAVEQFPRLAEFISTMEKTGDVDQAMYNAAEITTNFKRGGDVAKAANRNGATFLNASIQGFDKQIRNFTDIQSPKQAVQMLGKVVALGIAPGLLNDIMWDDDDEYKEMQDYQKDRYYLFKGKDGNWIRIPKGRAVSIFQSAARRTKYALGGQKDAYKGFGEFASGQVAPNNPFENNIISPIVDVKRNESWSGNKIVNDSMSKRPEAEQYNEKTDEFSKWLGGKINYSPMKINYLIDQYSGALGDVTLPTITSRSSSKTSNPVKAAFEDKFTTDSVYSNKSVNTFYDTKDQIEKEKNSIKSTPIDNAKNSYMTSKSIELSELYKKQKEIQSSDMNKKEKYEKAREVQQEINEFTKKAVEDVNNIQQEEYYLKIGDSYYKRVIKDGQEKYVRDSSKKIPTDSYALYDYFKEKYEKSKESD